MRRLSIWSHLTESLTAVVVKHLLKCGRWYWWEPNPNKATCESLSFRCPSRKQCDPHWDSNPQLSDPESTVDRLLRNLCRMASWAEFPPLPLGWCAPESRKDPLRLSVMELPWARGGVGSHEKDPTWCQTNWCQSGAEVMTHAVTDHIVSTVAAVLLSFFFFFGMYMESVSEQFSCSWIFPSRKEAGRGFKKEFILRSGQPSNTIHVSFQYHKILITPSHSFSWRPFQFKVPLNCSLF